MNCWVVSQKKADNSLCLFKVIFTVYYGKPPFNHHLGNSSFFFPTTASKSKVCIIIIWPESSCISSFARWAWNFYPGWDCYRRACLQCDDWQFVVVSQIQHHFKHHVRVQEEQVHEKLVKTFLFVTTCIRSVFSLTRCSLRFHKYHMSYIANMGYLDVFWQALGHGKK